MLEEARETKTTPTTPVLQRKTEVEPGLISTYSTVPKHWVTNTFLNSQHVSVNVSLSVSFFKMYSQKR